MAAANRLATTNGNGHATAEVAPERPAATGQANMTEQLRGLLMEWSKFAHTMAAAGVIALPERLLNKTTGLLDATAV